MLRAEVVVIPMGEPSFLKCQSCGALSWYADVPCPNPACPPLSVHVVPATGQHLIYTRADGSAGHVQIVRSLSESGSCAVFEATGDMRAVVKLPHRQLFVGYLDHADLVKEDLRREFAMLMRISSKASPDKRHLPELLGAGALYDGAPFLVMRFCDGVTLAALIDEGFDTLGTPPSLRMVLEALAGVARGLRLLHEAGIVHRDVKSNNVIVPLSAPSQTVLVDLGTAKPQSGDSATRRSSEIGPAISGLYAAPEYFIESRASKQTDLYSLGVTAFEALVGLYPHELELRELRGVDEIPVRHLLEVSVQLDIANLRRTAPPRFPDSAIERLPAAVRDFVSKLLAPLPDDRPRDADEVVHELEILLALVGGSTSTVTPMNLAEPNEERPSEAPPIRRRMYWPYAVASTAVGIAFAALFTLGPPPGTKTRDIRPMRTPFEPQPNVVADTGLVDPKPDVPVKLVVPQPGVMAGGTGPSPLPLTPQLPVPPVNTPVATDQALQALQALPTVPTVIATPGEIPTTPTGPIAVDPGQTTPVEPHRTKLRKTDTKLPSVRESADKIRKYSNIED